MNHKVSVIIPAYNAGDKLQRCIDSILSQSFSDFEVIVIDDGSQDDTPALCDSLCKLDVRLSCVHQKNGGPSAARNKGIDLATGRYLLFVDADDVILPNTLATVVSLADEENSDCVLFGVAGDRPLDVAKMKVYFSDITSVRCSILEGNTSRFSDCGYVIDAPWGKLYSTSLIKENNIRFPEALRRSEDSIFSLYYYEYARKISICPEKLYCYDFNEQSLVNSFSYNSVKMLPLILEENEKYISAFHQKEQMYKLASDKRVFSGVNEAETAYFFNPNNTSKLVGKYSEYKAFLKNNELQTRINNMSGESGLSKNQKIKRLLYKYPLFITFLIFYFQRKR